MIQFQFWAISDENAFSWYIHQISRIIMELGSMEEIRPQGSFGSQMKKPNKSKKKKMKNGLNSVKAYLNAQMKSN